MPTEMGVPMLPLDTPTQKWSWRGHDIVYQYQGREGPAVLLIHGFGACWGHWRKNIPVLAAHCRCYALDLLGFGASAKPQPSETVSYTFSTWGALVADFCQEVIGEPTILIGNSIGCVVAMETAVTQPALVRGIIALNCSLRLLHERKRSQLPFYRRWGAIALQNLLTWPGVGNLFFAQVAQETPVKRALLQAYPRSEAVTEELVAMLLRPAKDEGAAGVFLAFTGYDDGPLAEDLLPQIQVPVVFLWGAADPWEPLTLGRELQNYDCVQAFIELPGLGHCPQDEAPEQVNPLLLAWIERWSTGEHPH